MPRWGVYRVYRPFYCYGYHYGAFWPGYWGSHNLYDPWYYDPYYFDVYDGGDASFWEWEGETSVRLILSYVRGGERGEGFQHKFVFGRKKV